MTRGETRAWIGLVATLAIWSVYGVLIARGLAAGEEPGRWTVALFVEGVILSLAAQFGLTAVVAARIPVAERAPADERDRLIDGYAVRLGYGLLIATVVVVAVASSMAIGIGLPVGGYRLMSSETWSPVAIMANGLLLAVVLAEAVRCVTVLVLYRRAL